MTLIVDSGIRKGHGTRIHVPRPDGDKRPGWEDPALARSQPLSLPLAQAVRIAPATVETARAVMECDDYSSPAFWAAWTVWQLWCEGEKGKQRV